MGRERRWEERGGGKREEVRRKRRWEETVEKDGLQGRVCGSKGKRGDF